MEEIANVFYIMHAFRQFGWTLSPGVCSAEAVQREKNLFLKRTIVGLLGKIFQSHGFHLQINHIGPCASNGLNWFLITICYLRNISFQFVQLIKIFY